MADHFDPYHRWLGIPARQQPANLYRLLGIELFEGDVEVIRDAAQQRMGHVRTYQLGKHSELSQKILNELASAKACLLDEAERAEYDAQLRASMQARAAQTEEARPVRPDLTDLLADIGAVPAVTVPPPGLRKRPSRLTAWLAQRAAWLAIVSGGVVVIVAILLWAFLQSGADPSQSVADLNPPAANEVTERLSPPVPATAPEAVAPETKSLQPSPPRPLSSSEPPSAPPTPGEMPNPEPPSLTLDLGGGVTMELVLIPAGSFVMGSSDSDRGAQPNEKPQHEVRITKPFYLGKYEVTQEQWEAVMGNNAGRFKGPKNPVEQVSWEDCQGFLSRLQDKCGSLGTKFRLPREAEWEYACRAGSRTKYSFGDEEAKLGEYAWFGGNSGKSTHPVGQKKPNAWGLYDMHGNLWEWCEDWYGSEYYAVSAVDDPPGPDSGSGRVNRGGGWSSDAGLCRSADRIINLPGGRIINLGFRVARVAAE